MSVKFMWQISLALQTFGVSEGTRDAYVLWIDGEATREQVFEELERLMPDATLQDSVDANAILELCDLDAVKNVCFNCTLSLSQIYSIDGVNDGMDDQSSQERRQRYEKTAINAMAIKRL
jgi:hypothetical protein